jgi:FkbM family methyltransferase
VTVTAQLKLAVRRLGLEPAARRIYFHPKVAAATGLLSPGHRRNVRDDLHMSLLMSFILDARSNCIDVGANHGNMLGQMVRLAPAGRHLAFEPIPELADDLRRRFPTASVFPVALCDSNGTARFSCVVGDEALSGLSDRQFSRSSNILHYDVSTARLDDVTPPDYAPAFIKIDVEGAEFAVLNGARETLKRFKPTIWFEHDASCAYFNSTSEQIWDLLNGLEYRIFDSVGRGPLNRGEFGKSTRMWSFVAH